MVCSLCTASKQLDGVTRFRNINWAIDKRRVSAEAAMVCNSASQATNWEKNFGCVCEAYDLLWLLYLVQCAPYEGCYDADS